MKSKVYNNFFKIGHKISSPNPLTNPELDENWRNGGQIKIRPYAGLDTARIFKKIKKFCLWSLRSTIIFLKLVIKLEVQIRWPIQNRLKIDEMVAKSKSGFWTSSGVQCRFWPNFDLAVISSIFIRFWIGQRIWSLQFMSNSFKFFPDLRLHKQKISILPYPVTV